MIFWPAFASYSGFAPLVTQMLAGPGWAGTEAQPDTVPLANQLHGDGLSYRKISAALATQGHLTRTGKPHVASAVQKMLAD